MAVIVVRDRQGHTADFQLDKLDAMHVEVTLKPLVHPRAVLCTDGAAVCGLCPQLLNHTSDRACQAWPEGSRRRLSHSERNAYYSRLKRWMARFHGVATRYLGNYLGWRRMRERYQLAIKPADCFGNALGRPLQHLISSTLSIQAA